MRAGKGLVRAGSQEHAAHELLISSVIVADVPLAGLSFKISASFAITGPGSATNSGYDTSTNVTRSLFFSTSRTCRL